MGISDSKSSKEEKRKRPKRKHKNVIKNPHQLINSNPVDEKSRKKSSKQNLSQEIFQKSSVKEWDDESKKDETVVDVDSRKKRKRKDTDLESKAPQPRDKDSEETIQPPPRKKRKNKTEFADPREDLALNSQSRKALEYVFIQMNKPSKWKFNKALQNWIIRHLWSPEALPEIYYPLILQYLSKVQGGSRTKLVNDARIILHPEEAPPEPVKSSGKRARVVEQEIEMTTRVKPIPGPLITTPGPLLASEQVSVSNEPSSVIAEVEKANKKRRAQMLLEALSSN